MCHILCPWQLLRELETPWLRVTASIPQGQGKEVQNSSAISKRGRRLEPPSKWWGSNIDALWPYHRKEAPPERSKPAKASKAPDQQSPNAALPNAQRCSRNDGKNWQCSNACASGRNLCEKHWQYYLMRKARQVGGVRTTPKGKRGLPVTEAGGG
jgi:hypothetical protein